jgi:hypothetical protein
MKELAERLMALRQELVNTNWFITLDIGRHDAEIRVHMREEEFTAIFDDFDIADRKCDTFPTERYVVINGVRFFSLSENPATFCEHCGEWITDHNRGEFDTVCYYCQERNVDDRGMDDNKYLTGVE